MTKAEIIAELRRSAREDAPAPAVPLTDEQIGSVLAALLIARRYVLQNQEQHASVAYAINIMNDHRGIGTKERP